MNEPPDGFSQQLSRFIVGIDLGTTNCAVASSDTNDPQGAIHCVPLRQWVDLGVCEPRELLPSFHYQPLKEERNLLDGSPAIVGLAARQRGSQVPGRMIASAKSWLCHAGVDRTSPILPWQCDDDVQRISPVAASSSYLQAIREAWDKAKPDYPLAEQDIVLTLPASFDQVARQLTIEAAKQAGLERVMPIEEPQAAFYAWLAKHPHNWDSQVHAGQTILVCDIGGGTTDFTLIRVRQVTAQEQSDSTDTMGDELSQPNPALNTLNRQRLRLHRVAVGQHLILGGDNVDLALAGLAEAKMTGGESLPSRSWDALLAACTTAKESLLGDPPVESYTIHLPGIGSRLIGGGNQVAITKSEIRQVVLDGFFPLCPLDQRPLQQASGFREFGLPYAQDAAVTHHLAAFLWDHRSAGRSDNELRELADLSQARPDWVLFNGGVLASKQIAERIIGVVSIWFAGKGGLSEQWQPGVLEGERLDLAVAVGAAYFGRVKRGFGVEIEAKLACSYYLQVSTDPPRAVCIVPGSAGPGEQFSLPEPLKLAVGQPVQFPILFSSTRLSDRAGQQVELNEEEFAWLPPIRTVLNMAGKKNREVIPVELKIELSQIGTLQMWCQAIESSSRWQLEFDVRGSTQTELELKESTAIQSGVLEEGTALAARKVLQRAFGDERPAIKPSKVVAELCSVLDMNRHQWPPQLLRSIWQSLMELDSGRKQGPEYEARWLNLLGFALRPGYGMAADDWRVAETWRQVHGKLAFATLSSRIEVQILWRRIAGGFTAGQQLTVYQQIAGPLRQVLDPVRRMKGGAVGASELSELLRLAGALELLPKADKAQLGGWSLDLLKVPKYASYLAALYWCIARLGARQPSYGPLNCVVDSANVEAWLDRLLANPDDDPNYDLALMQCCRKVGDRYRDVNDDLRQRVLGVMRYRDSTAHYQQLVQTGGNLASEEAAQILGDSLPLGLTMRN